MTRAFRGAAGLLATTALAACTVGPDYHRPEVSTPPAYVEAPAGGAPMADPAHWWRSFGDAELNSLVERGLASNLDLQSAASRIRQARQQEVINGAPGLPHVSATGTALRLQTHSQDLSGLLGQVTGQGGSSGGGTAPPLMTPSDLEFYSLGFDATWEIDVFGGVRRSVEAARALTEAQVWSRRDSEVTLSAEIASDYLDLRWAQMRIGVLSQQIASQDQTLKIIADRASNGLGTELDVSQQQAQRAAAAAQIPPLQAQAKGDIDALSALVDATPATLTAELTTSPPPPLTPLTPQTGLPSDLLRRRPDVRMAERRLAAATAQIGVAVADLYPKFNLIGLGSMGGPKLSDAFNPNHASAIGIASIQWPIFQGGQIRATIRADREQALQAYLAYQQAVVQAVADVEQALSRLNGDAATADELQRQIDADMRTLTISRQQYRVGLSTLEPVLRAEQSLLEANNQLAQVKSSQARDLASLYKALGGGWEEAEIMDLRPTTYPRPGPAQRH